MFFSRPSTGRIILVLEVQSSMTRGSLVWLQEGHQPRVLFIDSRIVPYKTHVDATYFIKMTMRELGDTIASVTKHFHALKKSGGFPEMPHDIEEVHYSLSSPWAVSQAKALSLAFERPTKISRAKMRDALAAERDKLMKSAPDRPMELIEENIFDVRLNGYSLMSWEDKEASSIEVSYAITAGDPAMIKRFRDAVSHIHHRPKVYFHSSLLLQYVGLSKIIPDHESYTLIHVHGELTDVVIISDHSCVFFGSYPMGIRTMIHRFALATKTDDGVANSMLALYIGGRASAEQARALKPVVDALSAGWVGEFRKLYRESGLSAALPPETILTARLHEEFFAESFRTAYPQSSVRKMTVEEIAAHAAFDTKVERLHLVGICAVALDELTSH